MRESESLDRFKKSNNTEKTLVLGNSLYALHLTQLAKKKRKAAAACQLNQGT